MWPLVQEYSNGCIEELENHNFILEFKEIFQNTPGIENTSDEDIIEWMREDVGYEILREK